MGGMMADWQFWLAALAMGAAVLAALARAVLRAGAEVAPAAAFDMRVYRDQLAAIDSDLSRGVIEAEEAARLRVEVSRRLLDADRQAQRGAGPARRSGVLALALALPLIGAAYLAYDRLGAPGYPDLPLSERLAMSDRMRAERPSQAEMEAKAPKPAPAEVDPKFAALMEQLRAAMKTRPDDAKGWELLAANEARLGNLAAARAAMGQLLRIKGAGATADDHAGLAELMVMAAGGLVSAETEAELARALRIDPKNGTARYYMGLMAAQVGRFDRAFQMWEPLLDSPPDAPWQGPVRAQIADVAMRAGINFALPDAPGAAGGPDAAAMAAAEGLSAEDRQKMIEGMVAQLSDRLASEGGPVEDWAKLITSLGVLGRKDEAARIYAEAKTKFDGQPGEQGFLKEAALSAGLTP